MFNMKRILFAFAKKLKVTYCGSWGMTKDFRFLEYEVKKWDPTIEI